MTTAKVNLQVHTGPPPVKKLRSDRTVPAMERAMALKPGEWFYWLDAPTSWKASIKKWNLSRVEVYQAQDADKSTLVLVVSRPADAPERSTPPEPASAPGDAERAARLSPRQKKVLLTVADKGIALMGDITRHCGNSADDVIALVAGGLLAKERNKTTGRDEYSVSASGERIVKEIG